ncbi:MAG: hypothetical protein LBQ05_00425, partial [Christensenellaceae bacterium]|nr:hypothetical protein [Christensenellaceae bacterium]
GGYTLGGVWVGLTLSQYLDSETGKYVINGIDGIEDGEYEGDEFAFVPGTNIAATRTATYNVGLTFNDDGTFLMYYYYHYVYSDYDEGYAERIRPDDIENSNEYYSRGTYTVDGEIINVVITADGEMGEDDEIEWTDYEDDYDEETAYVTLNKHILVDGFVLTRK